MLGTLGAFIGIFCGVILIIVSIVRAYREKDKSLYYGTVLGFFMFLMFFSLILNQRALFWTFTAFAALVATLSVPSVLKYNKRKIEEALVGVDLSAPLRLRKFYTTTEWMKLAHRWGIGKTLLFVWLCMTPIGGVLFALNLWLKFMSATFILSFIVSYITCSIGSLILYYYAAKSALKEKPSEVLRVPAYRSLNAEDLYRKLLDRYMQVWGSKLGGTSALERNIQSCMKQGLNREEAIRKIAAWEYEGIPWER